MVETVQWVEQGSDSFGSSIYEPSSSPPVGGVAVGYLRKETGGAYASMPGQACFQRLLRGNQKFYLNKLAGATNKAFQVSKTHLQMEKDAVGTGLCGVSSPLQLDRNTAQRVATVGNFAQVKFVPFDYNLDSSLWSRERGPQVRLWTED